MDNSYVSIKVHRLNEPKYISSIKIIYREYYNKIKWIYIELSDKSGQIERILPDEFDKLIDKLAEIYNE